MAKKASKPKSISKSDILLMTVDELCSGGWGKFSSVLPGRGEAICG